MGLLQNPDCMGTGKVMPIRTSRKACACRIRRGGVIRQKVQCKAGRHVRQACGWVPQGVKLSIGVWGMYGGEKRYIDRRTDIPR